jgi:AcrR family transcriptional regulator
MSGGPKGFSKADLVEAALTEIEATGLESFTLRKAAARVGCDPMALMYHFESKLGLERAVADRLNAEARPGKHDGPWRERLRAFADRYRKVALKYPNAFALLPRFVTTGPADLASAEHVHRALADAGFADQEIVALGFGLYSAVIGLCLAETQGMLKSATAMDRATLAAIDPAVFPVTARLRPLMARKRGRLAFNATIDALLDGLTRKVVRQKPGVRARIPRRASL